MLKLGLIKEGKIPSDSRVALTPAQCKFLIKNFNDISIKVQKSDTRCYTDAEYKAAGIELVDDISDCDVLLGIKEIPKEQLIADKTYLFFSHTKKKQPYNQAMFQKILAKKITLIDYECLEHEDGARIIGFGFFAGIVGAHNGIMAYGNRTGAFQLNRVGKNDFRKLIHTYFGLRLPAIKVAVTGSGRVAHGVLEIMNLMGIKEVEPDEYLEKNFTYPVYTHLKGANLYEHKQLKTYQRNHFHDFPHEYDCKFKSYLPHTDILMNGVYWESNIPRLFELSDIKSSNFRLKTIADITDDANGSVPCNLGDATIADPVYGVDMDTFEKTAPYLPNSIDIMAVGNLPNELPRDASRYFGEQLIKFVLDDIRKGGKSNLLYKATIVKNGVINEPFEFLKQYGGV